MIFEGPKGSFDSAKACAKAHGVSVGSVYSACSRGRMGTLGNGRGKGRRGAPGGRPAIPVIIGKYRFPSYSEAARQLGSDYRRIRWAVRHGSQQAKELLLVAVMKWEVNTPPEILKEYRK